MKMHPAKMEILKIKRPRQLWYQFNKEARKRKCVKYTRKRLLNTHYKELANIFPEKKNETYTEEIIEEYYCAFRLGRLN